MDSYLVSFRNLSAQIASLQTQIHQSLDQSIIQSQLTNCISPADSKTAYVTGVYQAFTRRAPYRQRPTNCPNCGAPINSLLCEYCGTHFD